MSTLTIGWLLDLVKLKCQDEGNVDFEDEEWLDFYNLALTTLISITPRAYVIFDDTKLSAGIDQAIPADGLVLVDVPMNMGTSGTTPGRSVREVDLNAMRALKPDWTSQDQVTEVKHFVRIPGMDASWWCYPPSDGTGYVRQVYGATPPLIAYDADGDYINETIPVSNEYVGALPDLMLHHAYDVDTDYPGNEPQSMKHLQNAKAFLAVQDNKNAARK